LIREGDTLYDCYPEEGIYSVFLVRGREKGVAVDGWRCDLMQVYCSTGVVTARSDLIFTERYLNTLSPEPY
jgi:hypothetical protein